jgi:hypothetical protein
LLFLELLHGLELDRLLVFATFLESFELGLHEFTEHFHDIEVSHSSASILPLLSSVRKTIAVLVEGHWVRVEFDSGSMSDDTSDVSLLLALPVLEQVVVLLDRSAMIFGKVHHTHFTLVGLEVSDKAIVIARSRNALINSFGWSEQQLALHGITDETSARTFFEFAC